MTYSCVGFGDCASCYHSLTVSVNNQEFFLCALNDRVQYRCRNCNNRTIATLLDPRLTLHLCRYCYDKMEGEKTE